MCAVFQVAFGDIPAVITKMDSRGEENIFLFVPNLIGFARVILAIVSFYTMPIYPIITFVLYFLSAFLDAFDGLAARAFNQSTKFGALLDQLTDRVGTLCLMMVSTGKTTTLHCQFCLFIQTLGHFYPSYLFAFQVSAAVDISSHWMHGQVSLMSGKTSHKSIDLSGNSILRLYYQNKAVLFGMCFANEAFYVALYMLYFFEGPIGKSIRLCRLRLTSSPL